MKKKSLLFILLLAIFAPLAMNAQTTVTIGDLENAENDSYLPMNSLYEYSYTQQIYTAEEIGMAGTINSLTLWLSGNANLYEMPFDIYMLEVDKEAFTSTSDWVSVTADDIVYSGSVTVHNTDAEAYTFELSTPFVYSGGGNLLIAFDNNTGQWKSGLNGKVFTAEDGVLRSLYNRRDTNDINPLDMSGVTAVSNSNRAMRNVIELDIAPASTDCDMPTAIAVSDITSDGATVTWEGEGDTWNLRYKASTDDDYTLIEGLSVQSYTFEGTLANYTTYSVGVQTVCSGSTSSFKSTSFTTEDACATPTNLQITDVTAESATLTWTPGYQETTWTVKYKKSTETEYTTETVNGTPTLTLSNLSGLTTYYVQVYNCESYVSGNFTTAASIPLVEEFGASTPTGWSQKSGLLANVLDGTALSSGTAWYFGAGNGVFDDHARTNIYGTSRKHWLIMPSVMMENNVQLSFEVAYTAYSGTAQAPQQTGTDDKFVVLVSTDGMATWTILRQWDNAGSEYVLNSLNVTPIAVNFDLSAYTGQSVIVAFYVESTVDNADNNLHIDNVSIDYIPDCAKPAGLSTSNVTAHEATISWTSDAEAWQVILNDDEENIIDVEANTYTFTLLDPETTYTAKVRTNCSGIYSEWTNPVSFTTTIACPAPTALEVTPYGLTATFTWQSNASAWEVAYATDANADPDECTSTTVNEATYTANDLELGDYYFWVRANCGDLDGYSEWAGPVSVHIGFCMPAPTSVDGNGISNVTFGTDDYIVNNNTPKATYTDYTDLIGAVQAGTEASIAITFKTSYTYDTYVWVDLNNSLSFETDEVICYGVSTNANPTTLTLNFTIPATQTLGDFRLRIGSADSGLGSNPAYANPCYSGSYACFQDYTLRVLEAPSCLTPTDLAVNYTSGLTAEVTWVSEAETFNIDVNGEVTEGVTNPYTLEGLELATTYEVKVQANCGDNGVSEWTNAVSFATDLCMPENQCEITFDLTDSYGDGWNGAYIEVLDVETGTSLAQMSNNNIAKATETETYTLDVCDGREIQFVWHSGSFDSECSYIVTDITGEEIFSGNGTMSEPVNYTVNCPPTFTTEIPGYEYDNNPGGYYLIASPVMNDITPNADNGFITESYDLYRFNPDAEKEWENHKVHGFDIEHGRGYLYASMNTTTLQFTGTPNINSEVTLAYTGWNLIGNPSNIESAISLESFYVMNDDHDDLVAAENGRTVHGLEGIFVYGDEDDIITFTEQPAKRANSQVTLNIVGSNGNIIDRAIINFDRNSTLPKFMIDENNTKIYIPQEDADYAVISINSQNEIQVNFKAASTGKYTLRVETEGVNTSYLHLFDRLTGEDVNLFTTPEYSFIASLADAENRFVVRFSETSANDIFAYQSGSDVIVNGNGELQVFDVTGRMVMNIQVNGVQSFNMPNGVYVFKMIGDKVNTQKIVVR